MDKYVTLHNVIDTRTGKFHSIAVIRESIAHFFVPAFQEEKPEEVVEEAAVEETEETEVSPEEEEVTEDE